MQKNMQTYSKKNRTRTILVLSLGATFLSIVSFLMQYNRYPTSVKSVIWKKIQGLKQALVVFPSLPVWKACTLIIFVYLIIAAIIGYFSGFLHFKRVRNNWSQSLLLSILLFIQPGFFEEAVFRGVLLPYPKDDVGLLRKSVSAIASLVVFVIYHPINGMTFTPMSYQLFTDIRFLIQTVLLGITCTVLYFLSGSIWPSVIAHWLPVTVWILFFESSNLTRRGANSSNGT
jgi:predicted Abi (CAAX) family protease